MVDVITVTVVHQLTEQREVIAAMMSHVGADVKDVM